MIVKSLSILVREMFIFILRPTPGLRSVLCLPVLHQNGCLLMISLESDFDVFCGMHGCGSLWMVRLPVLY